MKKTISMIMMGIMAISLTACGSTGGQETTAANKETAEAKEAAETKESAETKEAAGETVKVEEEQEDAVKLNFIIQEADAAHVEEAIAPYLEEHKNVEVELVKVADFTAMNQKVLAAHQANDDFDLLFVNHVDTLAFTQGGILEPLNEYTEKDKVDYSKIIYPSLLESCIIEDKLYSIPVNTDTRVLAVNKDMFEKNNQKYPTTQKEMLEAAKSMTKGDEYGFVNSMTRSAYVPEYEQGVFLMGNGGTLYSLEEGKPSAKINTPEMKEYLNFNVELLNYMPKDCLSMSEDDGRKVFASGKAAMYIFGPWEYTLLPELDFTYELINIPSGSKESASTSGGYQLAIGSGSEQKEAAWELMKYITTTPEAMAKIAATALPTMEEAFNIAPYTDAKYDAFRKQLPTSYLPEVPVANLGQVVEEFNKYWTDVLYGKMSVDDACEQAQSSVQEVLDKN